MKTARQLLVVWLSFSLVVYCQGNTFKKIRYRGGTVESNVKPKDWGNRLTVTSDLITLELKDGQTLEIDPASVTVLSYGQEAHRRVGTMVVLGVLFPVALFGLFHKTRLHYIGLQYSDSEGNAQGLLLQGHKRDYRAILLALQVATGAPVSVAERERKFLAVGTVVVKPEEVKTAEVAEASQEGHKEATSEQGVCLVSSTPPSAKIWVDGDFVGNTPSRLSLAPGKHRVRISLEGYDDWEREVTVLPNSVVELNLVLQRSE